MFARSAWSYWAMMTLLLACCLTGSTCVDSSNQSPGVNDDPDQELADVLGADLSALTEAELADAEATLASLDEIGAEFDQLLETMDEDAAKTEMVTRLSADPAIEWAEASSQGIAFQYTDGLASGIILDPEDEDPEGMDESATDGGEFPDLLVDPAARMAKSQYLVASKKTILLNPHYWERQQLTDDLIATANARFRQCGYDDFVVYKNDQCQIGKFLRLSDYGIVHIYSHGCPWPSKHNIQRMYLMTGHIASKQSFALLKQRGLVPQDVAVIKRRYLNTNTKKYIYHISPNMLTWKNDFSASKSLVYLGFCLSWHGDFPDKVRDVSNAQAVLSVDWAVSTRKNVEWAKSMYDSMCDTSKDDAIDLRTWYYSEPHQYSRSETDASGNAITKMVRLRAKGEGETILWEEPEPMDPCLARAIRQQLGLADDAELTTSDLQELTALEVLNQGVQTLAGIDGCTNLETLSIGSNEIVDLSPLADLPNLKRLYAVDNKIRDVTPLAGATQLTELDLMHNFIGDISPLANLTNLTSLKVDWQQNKAISSLSGVENMTKLTWLGASGNTVANLTPVAGCTSLVTLNATHNAISSFSGVTGLSNLRSLRLDETEITSLSGLVGAACISNGAYITVTCCAIDTNCDPNAGSTAECDTHDQLEALGADIVWGYRGTCGTEPPLLGIPDEHATCDAQ